MAKLIYVTPMSLDGYLGQDDYEWSNPGDEGHAFISDIIRPIRTYLYGRKMYETMAVWESPDFLANLPLAMKDFARVWQEADKIIYSKTLDTASTKKTRLEREFDPQKIRDLKAKATHDISIGGSNLAAQAIRKGLVDEYQFFVVPQTIGSGISVLPSDIHIKLDLMESKRFGEGWLYLRYRAQA